MCTAMAAGAGIQAFGNIFAGKAQKDMHNANADYYEFMNDSVKSQAEKAVDSVQFNAGKNASRVRHQGQELSGRQRAVMASHGLSSQSVTYGKILDDTISRSEKDAIAIQYNADIQSANLRSNAIMKAANYKANAINERAAGKIAFANGLLTAGSQFASTWANWNETSKGENKVNTAKNSTAKGRNIQMFDTNYYTGTDRIDWDSDRYNMQSYMNKTRYQRQSGFGFQW